MTKRKDRNPVADSSITDAEQPTEVVNLFITSRGRNKRSKHAVVITPAPEAIRIPSTPLSNAFKIALGHATPMTVDKPFEFQFDDFDSSNIQAENGGGQSNDLHLGGVKVKKLCKENTVRLSYDVLYVY